MSKREGELEGVCFLPLGGDPDHPNVPDNFEEFFLVQGPRIFNWLVQECGGKMGAELTAKVSHSTMSRWSNSPPGQVFGQRQDLRSYRSIWFGYPSPFPGFDRICEEIYGEGTSFIGYCIERHGLQKTLRWLRGRRGFGLEMIDASEEQVLVACDVVGIPAVTRRRWRHGLRYPKQWAALDLMAKDVVGLSWLETVLRVRPDTMPRRVSHEALVCMVNEALENRA
jgi:hypothetical protein